MSGASLSLLDPAVAAVGAESPLLLPNFLKWLLPLREALKSSLIPATRLPEQPAENSRSLEGLKLADSTVG